MTPKTFAPAPVHDKNYFEALDGWRGICAVMVALFHFRAFSHVTDSTFVKSGGSFLDFFFVLSGFVIFANYLDRLKQGYSLRDFMLLRFGRLYPLHFFVLMLFIGGDLLQLIFPFLSKGATYPPFAGPGESWRYVLANLFLVHSMGVTDFISLNAPSWSISAEFYTYLIYALIIMFSRGRAAIIGAATIGMFIFMWLKPSLMGGTSHFGILRCIYGFGLGGLIWFLYIKVKNSLSGFNKIYFTIIEAALFVANFLYVELLIDFYETYPRFLIFSPLLFSLTVFVFAFQKGTVSRILMSPPFALIGALSYSIYMLHMFISGKIFYGVGHIAQKISGIRFFSQVNGADTLGTNIWMGDAICVLYISSVIISAYITYRLVEIPCRDWVRKKVRKAS